jgi:hypothetical protein
MCRSPCSPPTGPAPADSRAGGLRRHRTDARHDPGARHGSGAGQPGDVHRVHRYRHHQRHDDAQPAAHHHWLFVGLDTGGSHHARPVLPEDGGSRPELLCGFRRLFHLVVASNEAWPADDANVVSVGGTDLITASAAGPWKSETAWSDSGGGISPDKSRSRVAAALGRDQLQQQGFDDPSQRPGRVGKRELHLLCLRRPNHLHGKRVWRHQLRRAHVGRLHRPGQSAAVHANGG